MPSFSPAADCWYLTGPTACGKTAVGVELARRIDAEIVSLDSMAVYRGMDIGTAKPTPEERGGVPHHLLDVVDPNEQYSLAQYVEAAHRVIGEIRSRNREVLFVGGTPLYLKALLRGIFEGPPADWEFRRAVESELEQVGQQALYDRLAQVDPLSADKLHPNDTKRIIRALEVFKLTGEPISHLQEQFETARPADECRVFVLQWSRAELHRRIEQRVDEMFERGLIDEARGVVERYGELSRTACQALGYREVLEYVDGGGDMAETIEQVKVRTRQFARRQLTWFRGLSECHDVPVESETDSPSDASEIAERIVAMADCS